MGLLDRRDRLMATDSRDERILLAETNVVRLPHPEIEWRSRTGWTAAFGDVFVDNMEFTVQKYAHGDFATQAHLHVLKVLRARIDERIEELGG